MTRLATLIAALVAALTLTAAPAMGEPVVSGGEGQPIPGACDPLVTPDCPEPPPSPVQSAGDRPADRTFNQFKRSCKTEAKRWARVIFVVHELRMGNDGSSWWQQETRVGDWFRVFTPRGCQLRHNEWKRNHRGQVDGKAVRR